MDNNPNHFARLARGIVGRVLQAQSPNVAAVTGATTSSKGLTLALENALTSGGERSVKSGLEDSRRERQGQMKRGAQSAEKRRHRNTQELPKEGGTARTVPHGGE